MPRQRSSIATSRHSTPSYTRSQSRKHSPATSSQRRSRAVFLLRLVWALAVLWGEYGLFSWDVKSCDWPQQQQQQQQPGTRVLIVTDPQIPDWRSYADRNWALRSLTQWIIDNFARKSWRFVTSVHKPERIVFLGDLLDTAIYNTDRLEHASYVSHFKSIFPIPASVSQVLYCSGNHDTGLYLPPKEASHAREQFRDAFGPLQGSMQMGGHLVVWVDSQALLEERHRSTFDHGLTGKPDSAWTFVRSLADQLQPDQPVVLLSHIPLHRPDGTWCGPEREHRSPINAGAGLNYQNLLDSDTSRWLLEKLRPEVVFSGDDHDACVIDHPIQNPTSPKSTVREVTIKSFAMNMNVQRPGYLLMSLSEPHSSTDSLATQGCLLPNQISIYLSLYVPILLLTLLWLGIRTYLSTSSSSSSSSNPYKRVSTARGSKLSSSSNKRLSQSLNSFDADASSSSASEGEYGYGSPAHWSSYSYHTDEDGLPTPATASKFDSRVRRASRLHLWSADPELGSAPSLQLLGRLGPVSRYIVRPTVRVARRVLGSVKRQVSGHPRVERFAGDLGSVLWVPSALWAAFGLGFVWL